MTLIGAHKRKLSAERAPSERFRTGDFLLLLLVSLSMCGVAYRFSPAILGMFLPVFFFRRKDVPLLLPLCCLLFMKVVLSIFIEPTSGYQFYAMSYSWMAREVGTIFLFYAWILFGQNVLTAEKLCRMKGSHFLFFIGIIYMMLFSFSGSYVISGINNLIIVLYSLYYFLIVAAFPRIFRWISVALIVATALVPMQSSFTVISSVVLIALAVGKELRFVDKMVPWRKIAIFGVAFLMVMSLFAYLVYVRPVRESGEGNNGHARAVLATAGYEQFLSEPILGSPLGRGILPVQVVENFGWWQYFSDSDNYNIYALSFHNSFIYLLTRFGLFSIILFGLFFRRIPKLGPMHAVAFMLVLFLGTGANVVIESIRSGPAVGFALGLLLSLPVKAPFSTSSAKKEENAVPNTTISDHVKEQPRQRFLA